MALDDAEIRDAIEESKRQGVATAMRMQATSWRGMAAVMVDHARDLEQHADSIEKGVKPKPPAVARPTSEGNGVVERFDGELLRQQGIDALDVSPEMKDWMRQFHERFRRSPSFAPVLDTLVGAPLDVETAEAVAGLINERRAGYGG